MSYDLGVHLGTTSVVAAAAEGSRAEMISLGECGFVAGAAVHLRADGTMIAGDPAVRRHHLHPDRVVREVRRRLGDPTPIMIGGTAHATTVLLARMLSDVVARATVARGRPPDHVVLTHPASWGPFRRELFDEVPRLAGLSAARTVTEPVAAAVYYDASGRFEDGAAVAVFHMGGGTCEVTILRKELHDFDVLGTPESIERLGGADIDEAIVGYIDRATNGALAELDVDDPAIATTLARLHHDCVLAKMALSVKTDTVVPVFLPQRQVQIPLTRPTLEGLIQPLLDAPMTALRRALASAGIAPNDLSGICLTGGSTRIPLVGRTISDVLGRPVLTDTYPECVVALGAARLAKPSRRGTRLSVGHAVSAARGRTDPGRAVSGPIATEPGNRRSLASTLSHAASPQPDLATAATPPRPRAGYRAARIAVITVVATLLLMAAMVAGLIIILSAEGAIGGHKTSTFVPTLAPTSDPITGHG